MRIDGLRVGCIGAASSCLPVAAAAGAKLGQLPGRGIAVKQGMVVQVFLRLQQFVQFQQQQLLELLGPGSFALRGQFGK